MSVQAAQANLKDAAKELRLAWERARANWHDDASRKLGEDVIDLVDPKVSAAIKGMEHLIELIGTVRRECGDDPSD